MRSTVPRDEKQHLQSVLNLSHLFSQAQTSLSRSNSRSEWSFLRQKCRIDFSSATTRSVVFVRFDSRRVSSLSHSTSVFCRAVRYFSPYLPLVFLPSFPLYLLSLSLLLHLASAPPDYYSRSSASGSELARALSASTLARAHARTFVRRDNP